MHSIILLFHRILLVAISMRIATTTFTLRHDVKIERLDVVIQRLVIQKQFRHQAKVLAIRFGFFPVDFPEANRGLFVVCVFVFVNLLPRRVRDRALFLVLLHRFRFAHVLHTVRADVQHVALAGNFRVRAVVPRVHFVLSKLNALNIFHFCLLFVLFFRQLVDSR